MLNISTLLCINFLSCFTDTLPRQWFPECPQNCDCFTAPKEGTLSSDNNTISLICDQFPDMNELQVLQKYSINTLAFERVHMFDVMPRGYLDDLGINSIVFENSEISYQSLKPLIDENNHNLHHIKNEEIKVLTFLNCDFKSYGVGFNWSVFHALTSLQALHIEKGYLPTLDHVYFEPIAAQNIRTATFLSVQLNGIANTVFAKWQQLRMLTITDNNITDLNWVTSPLPNLWYLDLRHNGLRSVRVNLIQYYPKLKVLKLDNNKIKVISSLAVRPLIQMLTEFSFEGMTFCANSDMVWISEEARNVSPVKYPLFFEQSLWLAHCQEYDDGDMPDEYSRPLCNSLEPNNFAYNICKNS